MFARTSRAARLAALITVAVSAALTATGVFRAVRRSIDATDRVATLSRR